MRVLLLALHPRPLHAMAPPSTGLPAQLKRLGRYTIVRPLSKGGMALVYEARRDSLAGVSPRVAIKLILPEHADSATFKELFINEARLGASMHHQNLVQIQDFDSEGDRYFLVMEYVEGLTLRRCISLCERYGLTIPMGVIAEIGRQACDGLHYAHCATDEHGEHLRLVHRDIKPSNLILNPHGVVKVLDFGISKGRLREERKGSVKGTWGYMAPEQATGRGVRPASDVFGLAVVLYELAALRPMFVDKSKDAIKRLLADDHAARMAATLDSDYGPLVRVLIRALQRDGRARYRTGEDFGRALSSLLPDPITARDEVVRFFERVQALEKGARRPGATPERIPESQGSILAADESSVVAGAAVGWLATGFAAVAIAAVALVVMVGLGVALFGQPESEYTDAPSLPTELGEVEAPPTGSEPSPQTPPIQRAAPAGRPAIVAPTPTMEGEGEPEAPAPVRLRVVREPEVEAPPSGEAAATEAAAEELPQLLLPPSDEDTPADHGTLVIGARQPAEVYIGGQFVSEAPLKQTLPAGRYAISIVAADGRRRTFEVSIEAGKRTKRTWDFDRNSWR